MKRFKLLSLFAVALLWLGGQNANAITLTAVAGDHWGSNESPVQLVDGKTGTKWGNGGDGPHYAIFKTDLPVSPTSYVLRIANDTNTNPGRNWKTWKIYGANFASDADATKDAEVWALIDAQTDVELPTDQYAECVITVSGDDKNFYTYFKIVVEELVTPGQYMQMDEFWFKDYTVDISAFDEQIQKCKNFDLTGVDEPLTAEYTTKLNQLLSSEDPSVIEKLIGELNTLQAFITEYKDKTFAPLSAVGTGVWGDGFWGNLIDGDYNTKCGGGLPNDGAWLVFRATGGAQPFVYSLVTGKDTKSYPGRNWKTWKIYGANFENVADATRTAEGWVLLDSRENVGQDLFPAENLNPATFSFSEFPDGLDKTYYYFKVELIAAYDGTAYQMTELEFLTKQQVEETRASLLAEFDDFDVENLQVEPELADVKAQYLAKLEELKTTNDVVAMSKAYNALKELRKQLQASADYVAGDCYRALEGNTAWGDGENWTKLVDGDISTKWGGGMPEGGSYVVFKAYEAKTFNQYMLVTGNDTKNSPDRNWKTWKIYGCNPKGGDEAATREAAWTLLDSKEEIGQDRLPGDNFTPAFFNFSEEWAKSYKYFKIEVEAAYGGGNIQMSEFKFLSDEEYAAIRKEYVDSVQVLAMGLADLEATLNIPEAVKAKLMEQLTAAITDKVTAVATATADELLPAFNAALNYITVDVPAMIADYNLVEVDGVYQIGTANQLACFAIFVNSGELTANAVLTADIDLAEVTEANAWIPIGSWAAIEGGNACYKGHFDGQGHKITGFNGASTQNYYGIFGVVSTGCLIENFNIEGTFTLTHKTGGVVGYTRDTSTTMRNIHSYLNINNATAGNRPGGIVGSANNGTTIIENCTYSGTLDANDGGGSGNYGGIVGYVNNNTAAILNITNCLFDGKIINSAETPGNCTCGGFVGYSNSGIVTIKNCLSYGTVQSAITGQFFGAVKSNSSALINCYYQGTNVNGSASTVTMTATEVDETSLMNGAICYALNGDQTTINWFQSLSGTDDYPTPYGTDVVYLAGHKHCDGTLYEGETAVYSNTDKGETDEHIFVDGFCSYCNAFNEAYMKANEEGNFEIGTANQLKWFAVYVNQVNAAANAVVTADIDLKDVEWTPIGKGVSYGGTFDGQNFTISNFNYVGAGDCNGLFGKVVDATVKNFSINGTLKSAGTGTGVVGWSEKSSISNINSTLVIDATDGTLHHAAGVVGHAANGTTVQYCAFTGTMTVNAASNDCFAGIAGYANEYCLFNACANYGTITYENPNGYVGGIIGYVNNASCYGAHNCLNIGNIIYDGEGDPVYGGAIVGRLRGNNPDLWGDNYYKQGSAANGSGENQIPTNFEVTAEQLASGEVAAKLGSAFGQELGVDPYPVLGGKKVYDLAGTYSNNFDFEIESAQGDADCILPSMKYGGSYSAYTYVAQGDFDYGDWNTSNPNYNKIIGTPEEQDGKAWYMPGFNVAAWNYGKDLPNFGDGRPADVYAVRFFTVEGEIPSTLYMPAPHDDAPCEYYINGVQVFAETDGWYEDEVVRFTDEQKALIKANGTCVNVFAFHVHQNWGGRYADGGLYTAGDPVNAFKSSVEALDATIALAEKEGIDAEVIDFAKSKSNYRGGIGSGLAQVRKARRLAFDARTEDFKGTAPADGMIAYIYNVDAKMFLAGGNDWGTHASLNHMGAKCVLHANSSGANRYAIQTNLPNGRRGANDGLGHNGYVDCGYGDDFTTAQGWAWEFKALGDGTYNIINADNNLYLGMTDDDRLQVDTDKAADNPYNAWIFVTPEEFEALAADATEENPVDLGHLVHQATFSQNDFEGDDKGPANLYEDNEEVWKYSAWDRNAGSIWNWKGNSAGGDYMFEMWNTASKGYVYLIQEVEGLPAGNYTVSMNGYYRDGNFESADEGNVRQLAYLFAGSEDNCVPLASIVEGSGNCPGYGRGGASGIVIPDGCYDAAKFFQVGTYVNTIDAVVGADGKLKIGVYRDAEDVKGGDWITTDNWRLYYKGNPVEVTVTDAGYATFVAPGNITTIPEGVEAFAAQVKTDYVHLEPVTAIPAGEAVVLKAAEGTYSMKATAFTAELGTDNDLVAATEEVTADGTQYILAKQDETAGFAKATPDTKIPAGKGYLVITGADVKPFYPFTDDATGIKGVEIANESGLIYNLAGQRVSKAQKGINIINGKKVLK